MWLCERWSSSTLSQSSSLIFPPRGESTSSRSIHPNAALSPHLILHKLQCPWESSINSMKWRESQGRGQHKPYSSTNYSCGEFSPVYVWRMSAIVTDKPWILEKKGNSLLAPCDFNADVDVASQVKFLLIVVTLAKKMDGHYRSQSNILFKHVFKSF